MQLTTEDKDFYRDNGYVVLKNAMPLDILAAVRAMLMKLFRAHSMPKEDIFQACISAGAKLDQ